MGSHSPLQRIFLTQESNPGLLHRRQMLYQLSHEPELWVKDWAGRRWANWLRALGSHLCGESSLTRAVVAIVANSHRSSSLPVRGPSPLSQPDTFQNVTRSPPLVSYLCATLNYHSALHFSLDMFLLIGQPHVELQ